MGNRGKSLAWETPERVGPGEAQGLREQQGRELPAPLGSQLGALTDVLHSKFTFAFLLFWTHPKLQAPAY